MADIKLTLVVACALVDTDKRVLIAQRPEGKALAGLWEFPGGKVEPGERPEQTLIRELHEEIGIDVSEPCLAPLTFASYAYDSFHLLMPLYICRRWEGTVTAREGQQLAWVRANKLRDYPMPPADIPLIPHLIDLLMWRGRSPTPGTRRASTQNRENNPMQSRMGPCSQLPPTGIARQSRFFPFTAASKLAFAEPGRNGFC